MPVHIARLGDPVRDQPAETFAELAALRDVTAGRVTDDPEAATAILFTQAHMLGEDQRLTTFARHSLTRRFPERVVVYDERDRPWGAFPGVYTSMPRAYWQPARFRAWAYYMIRRPAEELVAKLETVVPDLLFSFVGSPTHPCREPLYELEHPDAIVERVTQFVFWDSGGAHFAARRERYQEILARSRFVLCPRGAGTGSIRLFEVLAAGRVPVIIADDWVAPDGPDWPAFSLRWPEGQLDGLVQSLIERDSDWAEMARRAQAAYEEFFAPEASVGHIFDRCEELVARPEAMAGPNWRDPAHLRGTADLARRQTRAQLGRVKRRVIRRPAPD